jgi:hypothetical protein
MQQIGSSSPPEVLFSGTGSVIRVTFFTTAKHWRRTTLEEVRMLSLTTITVAGLVVAVVLVWFFLRTRSSDLLGEMMDKRRPSARIVSRADYVEGMEKIPVALALTNDQFYYENPDLQASFDLNRIDEVEYTDELSTGKEVAHGCSALRLRSHGTVFEFVMPAAECAKWKALLTPRQLGQAAAQAS